MGGLMTRLLEFRGADELLAEEAAARAATSGAASPALLSALAQRIEGAFSEAKLFHDREVVPLLLEAQRLRKGEYDTAKLAAIKSAKGSEIFFNLADPRCETLSSWLFDVMAAEPSFQLEPTPIPYLSEEVMTRVLGDLDREVQARVAAGELDPMDEQALYLFGQQFYDRQLSAQYAEAEARARRMQKKIEDQFVEGGFMDAYADFGDDLVTYPFAVLMGPVLRSKKRANWVNGAVVVQDEVIPSFEAVSPYDFYPCPTARDVQEGYVCRVVRWTPAALSAQKGVDGWNAAAIDRAIAAGAKGISQPGEAEEARMSVRESEVMAGKHGQLLVGVEYWDCVDGAWLIEHGLHVEAGTYYPITAVKIGDEIVRCILNPDQRGYKPFYVHSVSRRARQIVGQGVPHKIKDCVDGACASARAMVDNAGFAAAPIIALAENALVGGVRYDKLQPRMLIYFDTRETGGANPIQFHQPEMHVADLIALVNFWQDQADVRSGVPRWSAGDPKLSGAAETARGFSLLFEMKNKDVKKLLWLQDRRVMRPLVESVYLWNLQYLQGPQWEPLKGDCQVLPRGVMALIVKQEQADQLRGLLQQTASPADALIFQVSERRTIWEELLRVLNLPGTFVPDEAELERRVRAQWDAQREAALQSVEATMPDLEGGGNG